MTLLDLRPRPGEAVYVYEFPVRLCHWLAAACIFTLFVSGHYIEHPAYGQNMGLVLAVHFTAGLVLCVVALCRVLWALFGNVVSRQIFIVPVWKKSWWQGLWYNLKWYAFIARRPALHMGHNPLAQAAMFVIVLVIGFMCLSGLGLLQAKSPSPPISWFHFMEDFIYRMGGNMLDLAVLHRLGMILLVAFVIIHVYMVIREAIMGDTTMIYTMITGNRLVMEKPAITRRLLRAEERADSAAGSKPGNAVIAEILSCAHEVFAPLPEQANENGSAPHAAGK